MIHSREAVNVKGCKECLHPGVGHAIWCTTMALPVGVDTAMLKTALAFLATHHEKARDRALCDASNDRFGVRVQCDCRRIAAHHQEQLYQVGEQTALFGGPNAYPRSDNS